MGIEESYNMWGYIIITIVVVTIILLLVFTTYNSLINLNNKVKEAFSTMDIYLKKRCDLIPNHVEIVKEYVKQRKNKKLVKKYLFINCNHIL